MGTTGRPGDRRRFRLRPGRGRCGASSPVAADPRRQPRRPGDRRRHPARHHRRRRRDQRRPRGRRARSGPLLEDPGRRVRSVGCGRRGPPRVGMEPREAGAVTKHVFVTGGVASSLGKGLTASSLGRLLRSRGLRVTMQKLDPYLNVDPGTMNPFQHGEVFVTDDGAETDLDIGHYERFLDRDLQPARQRHDRPGLLQRDRQGAARRLPRRHRPGHPAHHQRDQGTGSARWPTGDGRRRRDHRDRRHGRRHRVAAVPRGRPPGAPRHRPRQRLLPARLAGALHRPVRRAEDQADPALGRRAALHRHPARRDRAAAPTASCPRASSARSR